ncbi:hypothetical protein FD01_GL002126 [Lacticaseibacillus manihotivorans DSM 13343 = JCM 12514]|uniref:Uncharacterized protein n=1 Tax=Lacticaseibacillus manihotivorans DSM 13343 = JCM 12514 TaxID=1423769 RepID=A0A0R1QAI8_9LACO|nr:hypothetical protein FD01_GL002126 [Lacticaseibacillus manihotivorans DSM 13343 = JCM 12514]
MASLRKTGPVAGAAGSKDQQKPLMLLRLKNEPKQTTSFHFLPVKSARTAIKRRFT